MKDVGKFYRLERGEPVECTTDEWIESLTGPIVAGSLITETVGPTTIVTVFLGIEPGGLDKGPPLLWQSRIMVWSGRRRAEYEAEHPPVGSPSHAAALEAHAALVARVREALAARQAS